MAEPTTEIQYQRKKATFKYDADGLRSKKVFDGVTTEYQYIDGKLYYEGRSDGTKLYFFYDSFGDLTYIYYHKGSVKEKYAVVTNKRGDVVYIYSFDGATKLASYGYDAWGNIVSVTDTSTTGIASINPIRYRGYYYDTDLDLYYLQSRYYNPKIGRFLNADGYFSTGQGVLGHNMFAYCQSNPVNRFDPTGHSWASFKAWCDEKWNEFKGWVDKTFSSKETNITNNSTPTYGKGKVYICNNQDDANSLTDSCNKNDVVIVDYRINDDPNMRVMNSYKVTNQDHQREIAEIMCNYNEKIQLILLGIVQLIQ